MEETPETQPGWPGSPDRAAGHSGGKEVLLVFPGRHKAPDPQVPLQLLHVAAAARRAGYRKMNAVARYRWRHRAFGFPVELRLANFAAQRLRGFL